MSVLPDKPSELLAVALRDLEAVEKQKRRYTINMDGLWHGPEKKKCTVCFAGAVMANTLKAESGTFVYPSTFAETDQMKLMALDYARSGLWDDFAGYFSGPVWRSRLPRVPPYNQGRAAFKKAIRKAIAILRQEGK